jgi:LCP family protein required for cell wall assembly
MSDPSFRRRETTAKERIAQRRAARVAAATRNTPRRLRRPGRLSPALLIISGAAALIILVLVVVLGRARQTLQTIEQRDPRQPAATQVLGQSGDQATPNDPAAAQLPMVLRTPFNMLLIGVDRRPNPDEGVRSDTLILVRVDVPGRWASMLSIPRDSVVNIPHLGQQKINTAYGYGYTNARDLYGAGTTPEGGGGALAAEAVESFLGVRVDYIAQVDFRGFERIVNTLGGITVDVPQPLLDAQYPTEDYGVERIYIPAGLQRMDGTTALRYARSRHSGSDFDRSKRQQQVLQAILAEVRGRGLLDQATLLPDLARDMEQSVSTTLPVSDFSVLRALADMARALTPERILRFSINPNDVVLEQESGSDLYWSAADVAALVRKMQAGPADSSQVSQPTAPEQARIQVQNGAGVVGLAGRVSARLQQQGFTTAGPADALGNYPHTIVIDYTGRPQTREQLARWLGIDVQYVQATPPSDAPPPPPDADIVLILGADYQERWGGGQ